MAGDMNSDISGEASTKKRRLRKSNGSEQITPMCEISGKAVKMQKIESCDKRKQKSICHAFNMDGM